ncbi:MAG: EpsG family protein [Novosphingobium sp.]
MLVYWLFLALPSLMALFYPVGGAIQARRPGQDYAFWVFIVVYVALGALRYQTGGDWLNYENMFDEIRLDDLSFAVTFTDPLFGLLMWVSAQVGLGLPLVYAVCCFLLVYGVVQVCRQFEDPWIAIVIAVPYLLIVVGFGYVRQAAAIGLMLIAASSLARASNLRTGSYLVAATLFHSSAVITLPLFVFSIARRHKLLAMSFTVIAVTVFLVVLAPRLETFQAGYVDADFESSGAATRVAMGAVPALFLLVFRKGFNPLPEVRAFWFLIAVSNMLSVAALVLTASSTAVDRIALFFSVVQMAAFGEFRRMIGGGPGTAQLIRLLLIAVAVAIQFVWLTMADNSNFWVPYRWLIGQE